MTPAGSEGTSQLQLTSIHTNMHLNASLVGVGLPVFSHTAPNLHMDLRGLVGTKNLVGMARTESKRIIYLTSAQDSSYGPVVHYKTKEIATIVILCLYSNQNTTLESTTAS